MGDQTETFADRNDGWPQLFSRQRDELTALLEPWLASPPEHVGATAVPGLRGRPVIDVLLTVDAVHVAPAEAALIAADWRPEADDSGFGRALVHPADSAPTVRAFVLPPEAEAARSMVRFRDVLRNNRSLRVEYDALREWLSVRGGWSWGARSAANAKGAFVHQALRQSGLDSVPRPRIPAAAR